MPLLAKGLLRIYVPFVPSTDASELPEFGDYLVRPLLRQQVSAASTADRLLWVLRLDPFKSHFAVQFLALCYHLRPL